MAGGLRFFAFLVVCVGAQASQVTPMEKVIVLLKDLSAKVTAEGKKEAAEYDKYSCFCKEQADEKLYSTEKSDAKIAGLKAEIQELESAIAELNSDISDLSKAITALEKEIKDKTEARNKDHEVYLGKAKDMNEAIDACQAAIDALKDSKKSMKGAKLDLAQVKKATGALFSAVSQQPLLVVAPKAMALLSAVHGKAAPKFEYQSNDIIFTLNDLLAKFKSMKADLDVQEFDINAASESDRLGLSNEKKFKEQDKAEKQSTVEKKTEQLEGAKTDRDAEQKDRDADQQFLDELTKQCEDKAHLFDQNSKTRADELPALSQATAELEKGAVPNFSANKKLVGVELKAVVRKVVPASFLQVESVSQEQSQKEKALGRVLAFLNGAATRVGSVALTNAAMRVKVAEDHFVKVRALINDLIAKLEADAKAESDQKTICDKGMTRAITDRDTANGKIEKADAQITTLTANKNILEEDIHRLQKEIAENKKSILEATELRAEGKLENTKTTKMSAEGAAAVKSALEVLQEFYGKSLLQAMKYTPPKSDRDGNTVGDLAPDAFSSEYKGSGSESKGIIGIMEVILSDFERTESKTTEDEKQSQEDFEQFEKETQDDIDKKKDSIKKKDGELSDTKSDIIDEQNALGEAKSLLDLSISKLEDLEKMCVQGAESWEERKKKREEEIEALKQALDILEAWKN